MAECLDHEQVDAAYLCGRLLAVYEAMQYQALGEVNVSVGDRYYSMASTRPLLAFKRLEDLSRAHLKRLRRDKRGAAMALQQRVTELVERIGQSAGCNFPTALSLEEQGRFVIGYHHQKADDARQVKEARERRQASDSSDSPSGNA